MAVPAHPSSAPAAPVHHGTIDATPLWALTLHVEPHRLLTSVTGLLAADRPVGLSIDPEGLSTLTW